MGLFLRFESIYYLFINRVYCCFFAFYPIKIIYIWSTTIGMYFMKNVPNLLPFIYSFTNSPGSFFAIIFRCITHSSLLSMEEITLFAIVKWTVHEPDFLRLFMMYFKHGLLLWTHSSTEYVIPKLTYSYWFTVSFFFLFMLKKNLKISKCSVFNCFSLFF